MSLARNSEDLDLAKQQLIQELERSGVDQGSLIRIAGHLKKYSDQKPSLHINGKIIYLTQARRRQMIQYILKEEIEQINPPGSLTSPNIRNDIHELLRAGVEEIMLVRLLARLTIKPELILDQGQHSEISYRSNLPNGRFLLKSTLFDLECEDITKAQNQIAEGKDHPLSDLKESANELLMDAASLYKTLYTAYRGEPAVANSILVYLDKSRRMMDTLIQAADSKTKLFPIQSNLAIDLLDSLEQEKSKFKGAQKIFNRYRNLALAGIVGGILLATLATGWGGVAALIIVAGVTALAVANHGYRKKMFQNKIAFFEKQNNGIGKKLLNHIAKQKVTVKNAKLLAA